MHSVIFRIKRAFLSSTTFLRRTLRAHYGLTQARFDILYLVRNGIIRQCDVRRHLAIASTTLSEMLQTLEKLGLIFRVRDSGDRRTRIIHFTPVGLARTDAVIEQWIGRRAGLRMVRDIFQWKKDPAEAFFQIDNLEGNLGFVEQWFTPHRGINPYPDFHPDD
jgi:DNA-binding MarR family transcriptional regulator